MVPAAMRPSTHTASPIHFTQPSSVVSPSVPGGCTGSGSGSVDKRSEASRSSSASAAVVMFSGLLSR
ncbi:hypothetical protein ACFPRL_15255 [Pseudoclavibacter helvolus]